MTDRLSPTLAASFALLLAAAAPALAQQGSGAAGETNPQSSASTAVKAPAGVTTPAQVESDTQGPAGAMTGCKTASAEMTNGAVESCKKP